jgi:signal transduction histidine kinase
MSNDSQDLSRPEAEIQRLNVALSRSIRELDALTNAERVITSSLDLPTVLQLVIDEIRNLLNAEGASVLLREPSPDDDNELVFAAVAGPGSESLLGRRMASATTIAGSIARDRRSVLIADAQQHPLFNDRFDALSGLTTRTMLAVPLISKDVVQGVIEAINKSDGMFDTHDQVILESLARTAAVAIENARLYTTAQQRAEALEQALEHQRGLDRLQREFIQNVSHELRTPITVILGYAELLRGDETSSLSPADRDVLDLIANRARVLTQLVNDIVGFLDLETQALHRAPIALVQIVRNLLAEYATAAEQAGVSMTLEVGPELPLVAGDAAALRRMVDCLINNALKFTAKGGHVTVRLNHVEQAIALAVADTGVGIAPDKVDRIFDRFYQVDGSETRRYGGVGIGLALAKGIIEAHGGRISVDSQVGVGTTFTVVLPAAR